MQVAEEHISLIKLGLLLITKTLLLLTSVLSPPLPGSQSSPLSVLARMPIPVPTKWWWGSCSLTPPISQSFHPASGSATVGRWPPQLLVHPGSQRSSRSTDPPPARILHQHGHLRGRCHVGRCCTIVRKLGGAGGQTGRQPELWHKGCKFLHSIQFYNLDIYIYRYKMV